MKKILASLLLMVCLLPFSLKADELESPAAIGMLLETITSIPVKGKSTASLNLYAAPLT